MSRHIAFLRGINVGGHRVTGPELEAAFTDMDLENAKSFLASGNVVFDVPSARGLGKRIEKHLEATLGYAVPTLLRTAKEVHAIAREKPFTAKELGATTGKPQVTMLPKAPTPAARKLVLGLSTPDDRLAIVGKELYWLPILGISKSDLDHRAIERALGTHTTRTLNTIQRLEKKFLSTDEES
jgi:uncharacterized protein (DUF1697 family)